MRDANDRVRRIARSSADMVAETCRHLCAATATGQKYLDDVAAGRVVEEVGRVAAVKATLARSARCTCPR